MKLFTILTDLVKSTTDEITIISNEETIDSFIKELGLNKDSQTIKMEGEVNTRSLLFNGVKIIFMSKEECNLSNVIRE